MKFNVKNTRFRRTNASFKNRSQRSKKVSVIVGKQSSKVQVTNKLATAIKTFCL